MKLTATSIFSMPAVALLAIVTTLASPARAQTEPASAIEVQLRREIATLRDRLAKAEDRINSLLQENATLLEQIAKARRDSAEAASNPGGSVTPGEPMAEIPDDPFASPASMLKELRKRYEAEFTDLPHDTAPAIEDYKEDVETWCRVGLRDLRERRQWLVTIADIKEIPNDRRHFHATARVIDEASGLPIGRAFQTTIDTGDARKIEAGKDRFAYWRATVVVSPKATFNDQRTDAGVFENPMFVGRYCDFAMSLDWRMFQGVRGEEIKKTTTPPADQAPPRSGR